MNKSIPFLQDEKNVIRNVNIKSTKVFVVIEKSKSKIKKRRKNRNFKFQRNEANRVNVFFFVFLFFLIFKNMESIQNAFFLSSL